MCVTNTTPVGSQDKVQYLMCSCIFASHNVSLAITYSFQLHDCWSNSANYSSFIMFKNQYICTRCSIGDYRLCSLYLPFSLSLSVFLWLSPSLSLLFPILSPPHPFRLLVLAVLQDLLTV